MERHDQLRKNTNAPLIYGIFPSPNYESGQMCLMDEASIKVRFRICIYNFVSPTNEKLTPWCFNLQYSPVNRGMCGVSTCLCLARLIACLNSFKVCLTEFMLGNYINILQRNNRSYS